MYQRSVFGSKPRISPDHQLEYRSFPGLERPKERSDGWLEIEMGEFFNSGLEDEEVEISVMETKE